jgi:hypothetical protein
MDGTGALAAGGGGGHQVMNCAGAPPPPQECAVAVVRHVTRYSPWSLGLSSLSVDAGGASLH